MRYINIKAVLLGAVVGVLLDLLLGGVLMLGFAGVAFLPGISESQAQRAIAEAVLRPTFLLASLVVGSITSVVAGYVSARWAKRLPYANSAAVGALGMLLGLVFVDGDLPLWFNILYLGSVLPMALVGGHLARQAEYAEA